VAGPLKIRLLVLNGSTNGSSNSSRNSSTGVRRLRGAGTGTLQHMQMQRCASKQAQAVHALEPAARLCCQQQRCQPYAIRC
jgi:hypothetical protein